MWLQECQKYIYQAILNKFFVDLYIPFVCKTSFLCTVMNLNWNLSYYAHITEQSTVQLPLRKVEVLWFFSRFVHIVI